MNRNQLINIYKIRIAYFLVFLIDNINLFPFQCLVKFSLIRKDNIKIIKNIFKFLKNNSRNLDRFLRN